MRQTKSERDTKTDTETQRKRERYRLKHINTEKKRMIQRQT
jgi:hypothetical protein